MNFDWSEYSALAHNLVSQPNRAFDREAALRTAISRAYYAAYHKARLHLINRENVLTIPRTGAAHQEVQDAFLNSRNATRTKFGADLQRLRIARNDADYYNPLPVTTTIDKKAWTAVLLAQKLIHDVDSNQIPPPS